MAKTLELPALGQTMEEGTITQWFKAEGDSVTKGEALYEVMTDKVNMEVEAPEAGILRKILAPVDAIVPVNNPVGILGTADEDISGLMEGAGASEPLHASPRARRYADEYGVDIALLAGRGTGVDGRVVEADVVAFYEEQQAQKKAGPRVSPLAQRVAAEHGVLVGTVSGTGHGGKVTHDDVKRAVFPLLLLPHYWGTGGQTPLSPCAGCERWWPMPSRKARQPRRM